MSDDLCPELIEEIFQRLPLRSLLQCRSLSKSWLLRIDNPYFIQKHTLRFKATSTQKLLIQHMLSLRINSVQGVYSLHSEEQLPCYSRPVLTDISTTEFPRPNFGIFGSCNGILCLFNQTNRIILWNPLIKRQLTLPRVPPSSDSHGPIIRLVTIGFGFDPVLDDYKVVAISCKASRVAVKDSLVYTIKTHTWKKIDSSTRSFCFVEQRATFINGMLHWLVLSRSPEPNRCHLYLITFDLSSEVFGSIELPEPSWNNESLTTVKGSLAVVFYEGDNYVIWVRRTYKDTTSWNLFLKIGYLSSERRISKVWELRNGDFLFKTEDQGFKVYNPATRVRSRVVAIPGFSYVHDVDSYAVSLELLGIGTVCVGNQTLLDGRRKIRVRRYIGASLRQ